jgi:hypothetical protein
MEEQTRAISCTSSDEGITEAEDTFSGEMAIVNYKLFLVRSHIRFILFMSDLNWHC